MQMLKIHAEASEASLGAKDTSGYEKGQEQPCLLKVLWKQFVHFSPLPALPPPHASFGM